jgi:regulator of RNase E activity RraA
VEVGHVLIHPGDVIFADHDGVVVIPKQVVEATVDAAMLKVRSENHVRDELLQGKLLGEVYEKYGVL